MSTEREPRSLSDVRVATPSIPPGPERRRPVWLVSVLAGLAAMLLVYAGGVAFATTHSEQWTATVDVLIVPELPQADGGASSYFEVLSRGQVTGTAAEIMGDTRFLTSAAQDLGVDTPDDLAPKVSVVPDTAVVRVSVTTDDPAVAESLVDRLVTVSMPTVNELLSPFAARRLGSAEGSATRSGLTPGHFAAAIGVLSVVVGIAVQQAAQQIMTARRQVLRPKT